MILTNGEQPAEIERKMPKEIREAIRQNGLILEANIALIRAWSMPPMIFRGPLGGA